MSYFVANATDEGIPATMRASRTASSFNHGSFPGLPLAGKRDLNQPTNGFRARYLVFLARDPRIKSGQFIRREACIDRRRIDARASSPTFSFSSARY